MRTGSISRLLRSTAGAVAPTVALSLFGLIAAGGIAFDYARMASMDTELQSAADQAALAAASQLDGEPDACERAVGAARNMLSNKTLMANESAGARAITIADPGVCDGDSGITFNAAASIRFYQDIGKTTPSDDDSNAKFVEVSVDPREAFFALTPVVGAFSSGQVAAVAFAGLDSAICKVPPLMLCNPAETTDPDFTIAGYIGKGIRLIANDGGGTYGPGNFGFLDTGAGNGAQTLRELLGANNVPGNCASGDGVDTETGSIITVRAALNTRFGIYDTGSLNQACGTDGAGCPPSANIRKDLVLQGNGNNQSKLGFITGVGGNGWREADNPYPGASLITATGDKLRNLSDAEIASIAPMGYPEDKCHSFKADGTGTCTGGRIGDGDWDRYAYFRSNPLNYPTVTSPTAMNSFLTTNFGTTTPTRYQVYLWEMANSTDRLKPEVAPGGRSTYSRPSDLAGEPGGVSPSSTQIDRRVLAVAVINCAAEHVGGHTVDVNVKKWIEMFLVQPSVPRTVGTRTDNADVYVEVIGLTQNATDEGAVQLVKKSVPYLIE
jgi:Flp pilus assembly protein TadG